MPSFHNLCSTRSHRCSVQSPHEIGCEIRSHCVVNVKSLRLAGGLLSKTLFDPRCTRAIDAYLNFHNHPNALNAQHKQLSVMDCQITSYFGFGFSIIPQVIYHRIFTSFKPPIIIRYAIPTAQLRHKSILLFLHSLVAFCSVSHGLRSKLSLLILKTRIFSDYFCLGVHTLVNLVLYIYHWFSHHISSFFNISSAYNILTKLCSAFFAVR